MGAEYAGPEKQETVKRAIAKFQQCCVVYPNAIHEATGIDKNQALGALKKIAPKPGVEIDIGAQSKLTRCYRRLRPLQADNRWFYDPPEDSTLPLFPDLHELTAKHLPRVHNFLHRPKRSTTTENSQIRLKTY